MNRFDYIRPASIAEAVAAAAEPGSAYLGGGTNLLDLMKIGVTRPSRVISMTRPGRATPTFIRSRRLVPAPR
jgi:xanthine dehydrogenase YagS FAD-binding subunit